ncbi:mediator of RNA polymeras-like protein II transcription subunit 5 [Plenodomus tracheiphilus IPT5]|uniref:Mediator of RNA polymerase II transcription subunit 5 n=1 Tax=Plenodomus tracheiphilus IPT5 TaxID=1408161 RepID=A0A6A7ARA6_9PLEO|nr:mediator of RNA polymeras-like protein II transcription subunit 5 [Plenodomus tracheiphilus IPT5]
MESMEKDWKLCLDGCLDRRIPKNVFAAVVAQLHAKSPLPGRRIAALLLRPRSAGACSVDPRIIVYAEQLLESRIINAADVLISLFRYSKDRLPKTAESPKEAPWHSPPELEENIFHRLHKAFAAEERPINSAEGISTLTIVARWMQALVTSHTSDTMIQAMSGIQQQPQQQSVNVRDGLAMLVVGIVENSRILQILNHAKGEGLRKNFTQSLSSFVSFLSHNSAGSQISLQLANRIEISQKQHEFYVKIPTVNGGATEDSSLGVASLQLEATMDLPVINTRAGLYIFLNSLLVARPLTDDYTIMSYLHSRYKLEPQSMAMAVDLITASFDVLANAMYRSEPASTMFCLKSFLVNKVPILLAQLSASIFPMTLEMCITQALSHVDPNAFPAFSQGFDDMMGNNSSLSDVRQDFLNACALHSLLPTAAVERLLGETPMQGPPETRFDKKQLLDQCKSNFEKVGTYIDELDNLDGNAGAIVGAVTEFISHLCETQMTMYLKQISCMIFKKPQAMDVMLQFTSPASILRPISQFLDDWHYDSDQGEYQPVYDEFGAILVLIMAFVHRYDLTYRDLDIANNSFIAKIMERGHHSLSPDEMTEEQSRSLGIWLKGLYEHDKEGLSNDVFASCRPQDFYLIVPTLFNQTVLACSQGVLTFESVKSGLEYLGETFLLPSLIGGLRWLASYALLQTHKDLDAIMRIFKELMLSATSSGDAQAMHSAIIAMVSSHLETTFRTLQRRDPTRATIEPLLQAIKTNANFERSTYATVKELEQWTNAPYSTLHTALGHTVQQLSHWGSTAAMQPNPPSYTHLQIYATIRMLGAYKTLRAIIEAVTAQTNAGYGSAALDVGMSIICAPTVEDSPIPVDWAGSPIVAPPPQRTRMNLREMLKQEFDTAASLVATDTLTAETIVRLQRRVEAQLSSMNDAGLQARTINLPSVNITEIQSQTISDDINKAMDDAAAASIVEDISSMDNKALQRSMEELAGTDGLDLSSIGMGAGDASAVDMSTDLGNLPGLDLGDMGGMGMDMDMDMGSMDMSGGGDDDWGLDFDNM